MGAGVGENLTGSRSRGLTEGQVLYNNGNKGTQGTIISYALRTRYRLKNGASIKREKCKNLNSFYIIVYGPYELEIGKF